MVKRNKILKKVKLVTSVVLGSAFIFTMSVNPDIYVKASEDTQTVSSDYEDVNEKEEEEYHDKIEKEYFKSNDEIASYASSKTLTPQEKKEFKVIFLPVGKGTNGKVRGDAIFIQCDGEYALIDAGAESGRCYKFLESYRENGKINLKYVILTHHHNDHYTGLKKLVEASDVKVGKFYQPKSHSNLELFKNQDSGCTKESYTNLMKKIKAKWTCETIPNLNLDSDDISNETKTVKLRVGSATIYVYKNLIKNSDKNKWGCNEFENNRSLVCRVEYKGKRILLTGDVYSEIVQRTQNMWTNIYANKKGDASKVTSAEKNIQLRADVVKMQHHGILSTWNDTIKSIYTDGFNASVYVVSNSREPNDKGWKSGAVNRNNYLKSIGKKILYTTYKEQEIGK